MGGTKPDPFMTEFFLLVSAKMTKPNTPVPIASAKNATIVVTGALRSKNHQNRQSSDRDTEFHYVSNLRKVLSKGTCRGET